MNIFKRKSGECPPGRQTATGFGVLSHKEQEIFAPQEPECSESFKVIEPEAILEIPTGRHTVEYLETSDPLVVFFLDYYNHSCKLPSPFVDECKKLAISLRNNFNVTEK